MESYMHKASKHVLQNWLIKSGGSFGPFDWRSNRDEHPFGVWMEYPVCANGNQILSVWDESNWSIDLLGDQNIQHQRPPTYDECVRMGVIPAVIFDLAIQHKGAITYGIEIVHKHGIDENKIQTLDQIVENTHDTLTVYSVDAKYIMHQIATPAQPELGFEKICGDNWFDTYKQAVKSWLLEDFQEAQRECMLSKSEEAQIAKVLQSNNVDAMNDAMDFLRERLRWFDECEQIADEMVKNDSPPTTKDTTP